MWRICIDGVPVALRLRRCRDVVLYNVAVLSMWSAMPVMLVCVLLRQGNAAAVILFSLSPAATRQFLSVMGHRKLNQISGNRDTSFAVESISDTISDISKLPLLHQTRIFVSYV